MLKSWACACVLTLSLPLKAWALDSVVLQLRSTHAYQFAGYYAAIAQGYYAEVGLEVELREATPEFNSVGAVVSGEAQYGIGDSTLLIDRYAGLPVVVLATIFQHSPSVLVARYDAASEESLADLADAPVMLESNTEELQVMLRRAGVSVNRLELVPYRFDIDALATGEVSAISTDLTYDIFTLYQSQLPFRVYSPRSFGIDFYGDILYTSEQELTQHSRRVAAFTEASLRGWNYAMAQPDAMIDLIRDRYAPELSEEFLRFEYDEMRLLLRPELISMGHMNPARWQAIATTYADAGLLPHDFSLAGFLYLPDPQSRPVWLLLYSTFASITLVVAGRIVFHIVRTNRRLDNTITHLKHTQAALATSETQFRTLTDITAAGIVVLQGDRIVMSNPWLQRISGLNATDLNGYHWPDLIQESSHNQLLLKTSDQSDCWVKLNQTEITFQGQVSTLVTLFDITAQHLAEQELQVLNHELEQRVAERTQALAQNKDFIESIIETSPSIIYILDIPEQRNIFVSPNIYTVMGYTPTEAMQPGFHQRILTPKTWDQAIANIHAHNFEQNYVFIDEVEMQCANGEWRWFLTLETEYKHDEHGNVCQTIGNCLDITDQKKIQGSLKANERQYSALVNLASCIILRWRPDGTIFYMNPFGLNLFGYSEAELIGQNVLDTILPRADLDGHDLSRLIEDIFNYPDNFRFNANINRRKDGSLIWIAWGNTVIQDEEGQVVEVLAAGIDVTAQREATAALRESEAQFHYLANNVPALVWMSDAQSRCMYFNQPWLTFTGRSLEQELDYGWLDNVHPDDQDRCLATFVTAFEARESFTIDYRLGHADRTYHWIVDTGVPRFSEDHEFLGYIGSVIDISDRRLIEEEQERVNKQLSLANQEMSEAIQLKNDFLATMSHELRTPLNVILGMSEVLISAQNGELNQKQHKSVGMIERSANHLLKLINDILDLMRIESKQEALDRSAVNVWQLCNESLEYITHKAQQDNITIRLDVPDQSLTVHADSRRLLQVLINLLSNAVKFTPPNGQISLGASLDRASRMVVIAVQDSGIGIAAADLSKLFRKFSQLDSARNRKYEGTGLGLALVKHWVELHGGTVEVSSEVGRGSCFTVRLPSLSAVPSAAELSFPLVLIESDDPLCCDTLADYLQAKGFQVTYPHTCVATPAIVLADVEQHEAIARWQTAGVPVIVLAQSEDICAQAAACIVKPLQLMHVLETMRSLLVPTTNQTPS